MNQKEQYSPMFQKIYAKWRKRLSRIKKKQRENKSLTLKEKDLLNHRPKELALKEYEQLRQFVEPSSLSLPPKTVGEKFKEAMKKQAIRDIGYRGNVYALDSDRPSATVKTYSLIPIIINGKQDYIPIKPKKKKVNSVWSDLV